MSDMDMRDEFACRAFDVAAFFAHKHDNNNPRIIAANAYTIAEAMLEARQLSGRKERLEWALRWSKENDPLF